MFSGGPFSFDLTFTHWLQSWQSIGLTSAMKLISVISEPLLAASLLVLLAAWWFSRGKRSLAILIFLILAGNVITLGLKSYFDRPRPAAFDAVVMINESGHSFPSGHATAAMLVGGLIIYLAHIGRRGKAFWIFLSLVFILGVGVSRIYLGAHWLSDVLGGYAVGLVWLLLVFWLAWPKIRLREVQAEQPPIVVA